VIAHLVPAEEYARLKATRPDFWQTLRTFRDRADLASADLGRAFEGLRDRSKGRRFGW
jgi:hypothetical protein